MQFENTNENDPAEAGKNVRISQSTIASDCEEMLFEDPQSLFSHVNLNKSFRTDLLKNSVFQPELTNQMLTKLVDWLIGCFWRFDLDEETIVKSLTLLRIYLKNKVVEKPKLQGLSLACMFICSKYCRGTGLPIEDIIHACNGIYSIQEILEFEQDILKTLDFSLDFPSLHCYYAEYAGDNLFLYQDQYFKFFFWVQVSMLQGLMDQTSEKQLFQQLMMFIMNPNIRSEQVQRLLKFVKATEHKYVVKRCLSLFDIDSYISDLAME